MLLLLIALLVTAPSSGESFDLGIARDPAGVGLFLPGGLWLSGDITFFIERPQHQPAAGGIDDLSLLARWEPLDRLAFFGELRLDDPLEFVAGDGVQPRTAQLLVERLYAEALLTPELSLRVGKVYTPFGLWNVISRAPLTWTVERPAITSKIFPERATGLSVLYQTTWHGWSFDGTAYGPAQDQLTLGGANEFGSGLLFGTRLAAGRDLGPLFASLGLNAAGFRSWEPGTWRTAAGLDWEIYAHGHEITGELTYRSGPGSVHGLYVQDAFPLLGQLYGVLRFEYFQPPPRRGRAAVGQLVGLFWRPTPNLVFRADYFFGTRTLEEFQPGVEASFSLLF
jgi:hypothetical protein